MIISLLSGALVGVALGLTGGGGSILAVPLLLYGAGLDVRSAVLVSLAVVGLTSLYGAALQFRMVEWRAGALLGIGGILGALPGAWIGGKMPAALTLPLFAVLMLIVASRMWKGRGAQDVPLPGIACARTPSGALHYQWGCMGRLAGAGALTGLLAGVFGVGGGFLVLPALLMVTAMPMPAALATSLVAIFFISASAFFSNLAGAATFPAPVAFWFLLGGAGGMTAGAALKNSLPASYLSKIFAATVALVAVFILIREFLWVSD